MPLIVTGKRTAESLRAHGNILGDNNKKKKKKKKVRSVKVSSFDQGFTGKKHTFHHQ